MSKPSTIAILFTRTSLQIRFKFEARLFSVLKRTVNFHLALTGGGSRKFSVPVGVLALTNFALGYRFQLDIADLPIYGTI